MVCANDYLAKGMHELRFDELIELKYNSLGDATAELDPPASIRE